MMDADDRDEAPEAAGGRVDDEERRRRWRLVLGAPSEVGLGVRLGDRDRSMDQAMAAVYDRDPADGAPRRGGLGASAPNVSRWLGDIRQFFPTSVVRILQRDAMERLDLRRLLLEPELLEQVEPDVHLVANLIALASVMPNKTRETARLVIRKCVDDLQKRLEAPMRQAVTGALNRGAINRRPRHAEIDWPRTIRANLRHYQASLGTIIPETRIGFGRKRSSLKDIILCIDQSGSMASSVVYSGIFGAVLATLPAVSTRIVVFDTAVVDLTDKLHDPVEVLFGTQLGGGTDIHRALTYCQGLVRRPADTVLVLISDLIEGGLRDNLLRRAASLISSGVTLVTLLALSDDGAPAYDHENAQGLTALGSPAFACTPDLFPSLMAAALTKRPLASWAAENGVVATRGA
jgi:hypothetical protein